jgi:hypothetical protein
MNAPSRILRAFALPLVACSGAGAEVPAYSVAGTYVASSGDGIENIQFTDTTHYTMLRDVCPASDSCVETGTYAVATDGTSIAFTPSGEATYTYPLEAAPDGDTAESVHTLGGVALTGGGASALAPGGQQSLTSGAQETLAAKTVELTAFALRGQSFTAPNAKNITLGFASPTATADKMAQLTADLTGMEAFWKATTAQPSNVCHVYLPWNVATNSAAAEKEKGFAAYVPLAKSAGCQEILVSFQTQAVSACTGDDCSGVSDGNPKTPSDYKAAVKAFVDAWKDQVPLSFSAWNEPNNRSDEGNGTGTAGAAAGHVLDPVTAAQYYLALASVCGDNCKVAAGDLASVGICHDGNSTKDCMEDYQQNCPDDVVEPSKLCKEASYLDKYKNAIAHYGTQYHFKPGFRPAYFAYHGWREINDFISKGSKDCVASSCATAAIVESLGGSWRHAAIWNTEVGAGQTDAASDKTQAEGIGLILDWAASVSSRIDRVYYMGIVGGGWYVACPDGTRHPGAHRPGFHVLAARRLSYAGAASNVCGT